VPLPEQALLLTFVVGGETYALDSLRVREIIKPLPVRAIPGAPSGLAGVMQLRGNEVIPVVDLRARFALPPATDMQSRRIIICVVESRMVGVIVDAVVDVVNIDTAEIQSSQAVISKSAASYLAGVCQVKNRLLVLINLKRLLSVDDVVAMDNALQLGGSLSKGARS